MNFKEWLVIQLILKYHVTGLNKHSSKVPKYADFCDFCCC